MVHNNWAIVHNNGILIMQMMVQIWGSEGQKYTMYYSFTEMISTLTGYCYE